MAFSTCNIQGLVVVEPTIFEDSRGYFFESYNEDRFRQNGVMAAFIQDNQSRSSYGVVRGLHYQQPPFAQAKLVRVLEGIIIDVAVDIRNGSPTYGQHFAIELSAENKKQLFIPEGFAHGFSVVSDVAVVLYKCNAYYNKSSEGGILYNDPQLNIDWKVEPSKMIVSEKDLQLPAFGNAVSLF